MESETSELLIQNETLTQRVKTLQARIDELEKTLKQANDIIEDDIKARLEQKIMAASKYTVEDLSKMSVDELKAVEKVLSMSHAPYKGVRSAGEETRDTGLTVPNLYKFGKAGE